MLVGIVGFQGSGKNTLGDMLCEEYGFVTDSFATPLKDSAAAIFCWPRDMLEGDTIESRMWREQVDQYWSKKLGIEKFTPRQGMRLIGTEAMRQGIHPDIWVLSLYRRWENGGKKRTIVTDCRFPNEIDFIRNNGGIVIRIQRGPNPSWYNDMYYYNKNLATEEMVKEINLRKSTGEIPHDSETAWIGHPVDYKIDNDGTIEDLREKVKIQLSKVLSSI